MLSLSSAPAQFSWDDEAAAGSGQFAWDQFDPALARPVADPVVPIVRPFVAPVLEMEPLEEPCDLDLQVAD